MFVYIYALRKNIFVRFTIVGALQSASCSDVHSPVWLCVSVCV